MVYLTVDSEAMSQLMPYSPRLAEIDSKVRELSETIRDEDSKRREAEMQQEIDSLRREQRSIWGTMESIRTETLRKLLAKEYDLPLDHPKFSKVFSLAWSYGHASGFSEVENHFREFAELVK